MTILFSLKKFKFFEKKKDLMFSHWYPMEYTKLRMYINTCGTICYFKEESEDFLSFKIDHF